MEHRYEKGDLVRMKDAFRQKRPNTEEQPVGIVVDILTRSPQNSDWDKILVYMDGWIDAFSPRILQIVLNENKKKSK